MTPREIAQSAINILNQRITDEIFLIIQNNHELMHQYLRAVEDDGLDTTNKTIGKRVKIAYNLANEDREHNPVSTLIQSHQKFE